MRQISPSHWALCVTIGVLSVCGGCDKAKSANFNITVNGKKMQVKGLSGVKDLVTGKTSVDEAQAAAKTAEANGGTLQDRRRAAPAGLIAAAPTVDLNPLAKRKVNAAAKELVGKTVLCDLVGIINRETVGDKDTKAGLQFIADVKVSKLYARLYCRRDAKADRGVAVYSFLPTAFGPSIDSLRMGGKANLKVLGHAGGHWYGLVEGVAAYPGS